MASRQLSFAQRVSDLEQQYLSAFPRTPTKDQQSLSDRIRRALSWMKRAASVSHEDRPPRYMDLWIALNALYGRRYYGDEATTNDYSDFRVLVSTLADIKEGSAEIDKWITKRHVQGGIRDLVKNQYLYLEFWEGKPAALSEAIQHELDSVEWAFRNQHSTKALETLFSRLIALRHQIVHGSASADTRRNKDALVPAVLILEEMLPLLVHVLIKHGRGRLWPELPYPGYGTPLYPRPRSSR